MDYLRSYLTKEKINTIRQAIGLSKKEFSLFFGVNDSTILKWEKGKIKPNESCTCILKVLYEYIRLSKKKDTPIGNYYLYYLRSDMLEIIELRRRKRNSDIILLVIFKKISKISETIIVLSKNQ